MAKRDYYEVLGVERGADAAAIKRSFRKLARELHPDVNREDPEAEERFKEAAEAYEVLTDPERRRTYDAFGHEGLRAGGQRPPGAGFGSIQDIFESIFAGEGGGLGDIFGGGGGGGSGGPASGADLGVRIEIPLTDVLTGTTQEVEFEAVVACDHCHGNGAEPGTPIVTCETCDGVGQVRQVSQTAFGQMMRTGACPTCSGAGKIAEAPCEVCAGRGRRLAQRGWDVDVPAGIEDGQRIRINGAGHEGEVGGRAGDLYVEVGVEAGDDFHREGRDLVTVLELPVTAAMLGATMAVPTLEGEREVEINPGAQHGETIKLRGQGLPGLRRASRGDLHVVLKLITPIKLDDEQRELVERLEASLGERNQPKAAKGGLFERVRRAFR